MASASPAARVQIPTRGFPGSGFYRRPDVIAILDADDPYVHRSQGQFGHGAVAGRSQPIGRDLTKPRPEPSVLGGGKTQKANGRHSSLKRVSLTERRQDAGAHWKDVPRRRNDGYPIPANQRTGCQKRIVYGAKALL
jgi:hypothetical protein